MARKYIPQNEALEQETLFTWARMQEVAHPELELMFHVPNGGKRSKAEAAHLKRQGVKAGVPDIFLPVPRGRYNGLWIELKSGRNTATEKQKEWIERLRAQGYAAEVCVGWECAVMAIETYLDIHPRTMIGRGNG